MAKLVILSQGLAGRAHELAVDKTTIGRVEDNTFQINEPSVSSHHCEILLRGNEVLASIMMFVLLYALLFALFLILLNKRIQQGPEALDQGEHPTSLPDTFREVFRQARASGE
jgi:hypothetical protein